MPSDQKQPRTVIGTILRQPLVFLGAIGVVSMLKGLITIHEDILVLVQAYQAVTQPIWDFLLGWLFDLIGWRFPAWLKDYLTMGVISYSAFSRTKNKINTYNTRNYSSAIISAISSIAIWPFHLLLYTFAFLFSPKYTVDQIKTKEKLLKHLESENPGKYPSEYWPTYDLRNERISNLKIDIEQNYNSIESLIYMEVVLWIFSMIAISYGLFWIKP